jgi:hypothetical protein
MLAIVVSLVAAVARKFMHDRHADLYLEWRRLSIFGLEQTDFWLERNDPARPIIFTL